MTKPSSTENRAKYIKWTDEDWILFTRCFLELYPARNPLDEKFRIKDSEFRSVQEKIFPFERQRTISSSLLSRSTETIRTTISSNNSIFSMPHEKLIVENKVPENNKESSLPDSSKRDFALAAVNSQDDAKEDRRIRWGLAEWALIAKGLQTADASNGRSSFAKQSDLKNLKPKDIYLAQHLLPTELHRTMQSLNTTMLLARSKLKAAFPADADVSPSYATQSKQPDLQFSVVSATPVHAEPPLFDKSAEASVQAVENVAASAPVEPSPAALDNPVSESKTAISSSSPRKIGAQEVAIFSEIMRPLVAMFCQEIVAAIARALPDNFSRLIEGHDLLGLMAAAAGQMTPKVSANVMSADNHSLPAQPDPAQAAPNAASTADLPVQPTLPAYIVTALAGKKSSTSPDVYAAARHSNSESQATPPEPATSPLMEASDFEEPNGNIAPMVSEQVIDDEDDKILKNPLAFLGSNERFKVAVVGIHWKRTNELRELKSSFPSIDFVCLEGGKDVEVSRLSQCNKVIGMSGLVKANVDKMLSQVMPGKYSVADGGINGVIKKINKMIDNGDFLRSRM